MPIPQLRQLKLTIQQVKVEIPTNPNLLPEVEIIGRDGRNRLAHLTAIGGHAERVAQMHLQPGQHITTWYDPAHDQPHPIHGGHVIEQAPIEA